MGYAQYDRRNLRVRLGVAIGAAAMALSTGAAHADLGDQLAKLLADDGASVDIFGLSVAISGTTAIVGAYRNDDNGSNSGSAYLYDITTGLQLFKLLPDDGAAGDEFGISVGISGTTAIVGAWHDDDNGGNSGSAYLYDITTGLQLFKLLADDGAGVDEFGWSVAISGTTAIVGARLDGLFDSGSAYLYDITTGLQLFKLLPDDGAAEDQFGNSVGISGTTAIVAAELDDDNGTQSGSAYLYDITTGLQLFKLLPDDGAANDRFGRSVAISGAIAIVGAWQDNDNGVVSGSAYLYDITTGLQLFKLLADDGAEDDEFGISVGISGTTAIVGARFDDNNGSASGSAYLYDITTGLQLFKLLPDDGAAGDQFGYSVAISGTTAIVGAISDDDNGNGSGSAYLFSASDINFDPPQVFDADGKATSQAVGSFDAIDNGSPDVAVVIPGPDEVTPGNVQVFLNQGNDKETGDWNGLLAGALIPVGTQPSGITTGFFNADAFVDVAVSNAGDDQLSILLGDGNGSFTPGTPEDVGPVPSAVASGYFDLDGNTDLVVANAIDNTVWVLFGDGLGGFPKSSTQSTFGLLPIDVDPGDLDNDKDLDVVGINSEMSKGEPLNGSVFVMLNNGDGTFADAVNYPVGIDPRQLAIADVDGDEFNDVVVVNGADATLSILLNQGDGTLGEAIEVSVGTTPRSIDTVDLDLDGDPDLVIAADNLVMEPVVQVLANVTFVSGEPLFDLPLEFSVNADPNFVATADFDMNDFFDVVTANTDEGDTTGSVTVLLNDPPCPWDLDGNESTGLNDLLLLLDAWGVNPSHPADFDEDGFVGLSDLLALLANWGPCP